MSGDTVITVVGNLTADPELRFTSSGAAVANFTVASTPRIFDRASNEWKDGEGSRVIVSGRLKQRSFETKEGEKRTVIELEVEEIGPSLRYATAKVNKAARTNDARPTTAGNNQDDPWPAASSGYTDEPPF